MVNNRHWRSHDFSTWGGGGQSEEAKWPSGGGCGRGCPPLTVGRFFSFSCIKMSFFFCTLNVIIRGGLCEVAYTNHFSPPPPLFPFLFTPISGMWGGGIGPLCSLCSGIGQLPTQFPFSFFYSPINRGAPCQINDDDNNNNNDNSSKGDSAKMDPFKPLWPIWTL